MPKVFISYRRSDSEDVTGRIFDRLSAHFGPENVFEDIDAIPLGADFIEQIKEAIEHCDLVLAIIGQTWLTVTDDSGARRLDDPKDIVRQELEAGLESGGVQVIPVLVQQAGIPEKDQLPESLKPLVRVNAAPIRPGRDFEHDVTALIEAMAGYDKPPSRLFRVALAAVASVLLLVAAFWAYRTTITGMTEDVTALNNDVIAVLPLDNLSTSAEHAFFTDGMHDDLLTQLSRVGAWSVISRTSVERFRDTDLSMQEIGEILNARNIVEGSVQRAGNRVRINVQLIDASDDKHLWAETYDRELTAVNIFTIQSEITQAIAAELKKALTPEEQNRIATAHSQNLEAYQSYLLGRDRWRRRNLSGLEEAETLFKKAIELDPDYALAYSGLSDTYVFQNSYTRLPHPEQQFEKAEAALQKALSRTDQLGEVYASLGLLYQNLNRPVEADQAYKRALELNPSYPMTFNWYGEMLGTEGRTDESLAMIMRALELEPLSVIVHFNASIAMLLVERYEEALALSKKAITIDPDSFFGYMGVARHYCLQGRMDECVRWLIKGSHKAPNNAPYRNHVAWPYLDLGDDVMVEQWAALAQAISPGAELHLSAAIALYRNDRETAVRLAREVVDFHPGGLGYSFALLRDDDLANDRIDQTRARYAKHFPDIIGPDGIATSIRRPNAAVDIAYFLQKSGSEREATQLLDTLGALDAIPQYQNAPVARVRILVLQGLNEEALAKLREVFDTGWRIGWWYYFDHDPVLEPLRGSPEFQSIRDQIATDMVEQLAHVRAMVANGEIVVPEN